MRRVSALVVLAIVAAIGCGLKIDTGPKPTGGSTITTPPASPAPTGTFEDRRCGGLSYPSSACDDCFRSHCCIDGITCASKPSCLALRNCWASCEDETCGGQCATEYGDGEYESDKLDGCMESFCSSVCE